MIFLEKILNKKDNIVKLKTMPGNLLKKDLHDFVFYDQFVSIEKNNPEQHSALFLVNIAIKLLKKYDKIHEALKASGACISDEEIDSWETYRRFIKEYGHYIITRFQQGYDFYLSFYPITNAFYNDDINVHNGELRKFSFVTNKMIYIYKINDEIEYKIPYYVTGIEFSKIKDAKEWLLKKYYRYFFDFINHVLNNSMLVLGYMECEMHVFYRFVEALSNLCVMYNMFDNKFYVGVHPLYLVNLYKKASGDLGIPLKVFYEQAFRKQITEKIIYALNDFEDGVFTTG